MIETVRVGSELPDEALLSRSDDLLVDFDAHSRCFRSS
jgi:hypothetical protein